MKEVTVSLNTHEVASDPWTQNQILQVFYIQN